MLNVFCVRSRFNGSAGRTPSLNPIAAIIQKPVLKLKAKFSWAKRDPNDFDM